MNKILTSTVIGLAIIAIVSFTIVFAGPSIGLSPGHDGDEPGLDEVDLTGTPKVGLLSLILNIGIFAAGIIAGIIFAVMFLPEIKKKI